MKKSLFKKLSSFMLSLAVASSAVLTPLPPGVSAASTGSYTITIKPGETTVTPDDMEGDTTDAKERFTAYQIFTGTLQPAEGSDYDDNGDLHPKMMKDDDFNAIVDYIQAGNEEYDADELPASCTEEFFETVKGLIEKATEELEEEAAGADVSDDDIKDKAYELYEDDWRERHKMTELDWGDDVDTDRIGALLTELNTTFPNMGFGSIESTNTTEAAQQVAALLVENIKDTANLQKFAKVMKKYVNGSGTKSDWDDGAWKIEVDGGYYLIVDELADLEAGDSTAPYFLDVAQNITCMIKSTSPTIDKSITKVIDSKDEEDPTNGQGTVAADGNTAVAGIGDIIEFKLEGTLPENFATFYEKYYYQFVDNMSNSLTYVEDSLKVQYVIGTADPVNITVDGTNVKVEASKDSQDIKVTITDLRQILTNSVLGSHAMSEVKVVVTYQAYLNENAKVGEVNKNTAHIVYTSDPNTDEDGNSSTTNTNETTKDEVTVYTYEIDIKKTDEDDVTLANAGFSIKRESDNNYAVFVKSAEGVYTVVAWISADEFDSIDDDSNTIDVALADLIEELTENNIIASADDITVEAVTKDDGTLKIIGLDPGTYVFNETTVPALHIKANPFKVTLVAKTADGAYTKALKENDTKVESVNSEDDESAELVTKTTLANGIASLLVIDPTNSIMPDTGGMGRYLFYIGGAIFLLAGAGILFMTKKKSATKK